MAKKLFVFGIGGSGLRVMKSLTMLLASGMKPGDFDEVVPLLIDPHKELKEYVKCNELIALYKSIHTDLYAEKQEVADGFFRVKFGSLESSEDNETTTGEKIKSDISFDEKSNEIFGNYIGLPDIEDSQPESADFLSLLYSDKNFKQPLSKGFKGNPNMGSMALSTLIGGEAYNTFVNSFGAEDRIFIISSVFGGTGASGFPLLLHNFRDETEMKKQHIRNAQIGSLSLLPYYKLSEPGQTSDIDSNDFMTKTKSALTYYSRDKFTKLYNSMYYIADPDGQTTGYDNDESNQNNSAHLVEVLGALSIFHFAAQKSFPRSTVHEYCLNDKVDQVTFKQIGEPSKKLLAKNLSAFQLLTKLHKHLKMNAGKLAVCKVNDFTSDFFDGEFFKNSEKGFDKFLNEHYHSWINGLNTNRRGFSPFNLQMDNHFNYLVNTAETDPMGTFLFRQPTNMSHLLVNIAETSTDKSVRKIDNKHLNTRYLLMNWMAINNFISSKINV